MTPRKPNSALRKVVRVALMSHSQRKNVNAYIPGMGHTLIKFSSVLLRGGNRKDLPGVKYILVRNKLDFVGMPGKYRRQSRSRYGVKYDKTHHRKHYWDKKYKKKDIDLKTKWQYDKKQKLKNKPLTTNDVFFYSGHLQKFINKFMRCGKKKNNRIRGKTSFFKYKKKKIKIRTYSIVL